jgi:hyperosmotically inducible protein
MISRNLARAGLVAAILLGGVGLTACAMENPDATFSVATAGDSLDAAVNDRVEQLLRTDVGLAGSQFRIHGTARP